MRKLHLLVLAAGAAAAGVLVPTLAYAVGVEVDTGTTYQTMKGWEVTLNGFSFLAPDPRTDLYNDEIDPYRVVVIDKMVNELGINRVRLEIRSGAENPEDWFGTFLGGSVTNQSVRIYRYQKINDNDDPSVADPAGFQWTEIDHAVEKGLLPMKDLVEANGERLWVSLCYVDFNFEPEQGTLAHGAVPAEYAELIAETFAHLDTTYGIVPDSLEVVLEPENSNDWPSAAIGPAMVAAVTRLRDDGYDPEVIAPSVRSAGNTVSYLDDIMDTPGADGMLTMVSYHRYAVPDLMAIWSAAQGYGLETGMLEHTGGTAELLWEDLTIANVSAWQKWGWVAANPEYAESFYYLSDLEAAAPNATLTPLGAPLLPFFRYVRLGATRIQAQADSNGWFPVAFLNSNGSTVVVLRTATQPGTLDLTGLPDGTYGITRVASDGTITEETGLTVSGGTLSTTTLGGSVMAIYDSNTPGPNGGVGVGGSSGAGGTGGADSGEGGSSAEAGSEASGGVTATGGNGMDAGEGGGTGVAGGDGSSGMASGGVASGGVSGNVSGGGASARGGTGGRTDTSASGGADDNGGQAPAVDASNEDGGCGCRVAGSPSFGSGRIAGAALLLTALWFVRRGNRASAAGVR